MGTLRAAVGVTVTEGGAVFCALAALPLDEDTGREDDETTDKAAPEEGEGEREGETPVPEAS